MHFITSALLLSSLFLSSIVAKPTANGIIVARGQGHDNHDDHDDHDDHHHYKEDKHQSKADLQKVSLRIEGSTTTIFEGFVFSSGQDVTTPSGGTHNCDGTNNGANAKPGNTPTDALATASKSAHFPFDGTFESEFNDFFISSIGPDTQTATEFWGLLVNYKFTPTGGCQFETATNDQVLWAFNAFNAFHILKLDGPNNTGTVNRNQAFVLTVTDGNTGLLVVGATVKIVDGGSGSATTDGSGHATFTLGRGKYTFKASAPSSIRSNAQKVEVI